MLKWDSTCALSKVSLLVGESAMKLLTSNSTTFVILSSKMAFFGRKYLPCQTKCPKTGAVRWKYCLNITTTSRERE